MLKFSRLAALAAALLVVSACGDSNPVAPRIEDADFAPSLGVDLTLMERKASGLYIQELNEGTGTPASFGNYVDVRYTGWLVNGTRFDSNVDPEGDLLEVLLGAGRVIDGFGEGLRGIRPGGRRKLVIPPRLGYGKQKQGDIPANSILVFEVEAVNVR